jgi:hypothetical protein
MKKIVGLSVAAVFVVSVVFVNFFGLMFSSLNAVIYAEKVCFTIPVEDMIWREGRPYVVAREGEQYRLSWRILPEGVTEPGVVFAVSTAVPGDGVSDDGVASFAKVGMRRLLSVSIRSAAAADAEGDTVTFDICP